MITEEFSFPIIANNNVVHLTVLPPLWRITSINNHDHDQLEDNGRKLKRAFRRFSEVKGKISKVESNIEKAEAEVEAEEKMDMLWEDFNEELKSCNNVIDSRYSSVSDPESDYRRRSDRGEEIDETECCNNIVRGLEMVPAKKRKLKLVVKMMKKLFLVQSMARNKRNCPRY